MPRCEGQRVFRNWFAHLVGDKAVPRQFRIRDFEKQVAAKESPARDSTSLALYAYQTIKEKSTSQ
jgi:hypothetical protein